MGRPGLQRGVTRRGATVIANGMFFVLALAFDGGLVQAGPPDPIVEQQIRQQLELLKQKLRQADEELPRLLTEHEQHLRAAQELIERSEKGVRDAEYLLAKRKAPRVHLPRAGLVYEYQRMATEARRAGQRVSP